MNPVSIVAMFVVFLGGVCILAGYMLTNAFHKFRVYLQTRKEVKA